MPNITRYCVDVLLTWSAAHFWYFCVIFSKGGLGQIDPDVGFNVHLNASCPEMRDRNDIQSLVTTNQIFSIVSIAILFVWLLCGLLAPEMKNHFVFVWTPNPNDPEIFLLKSHKVSLYEAIFHCWAIVFFIWVIVAFASYTSVYLHHQCTGYLYFWFFANFMLLALPGCCVNVIYMDGYNHALLKQDQEKTFDDVSLKYELLDEENRFPQLLKQ